MFRLIVIFLVFTNIKQICNRPIPKNEDISYALYCIDLLELNTYLFQGFVFEEERHNSIDNVIVNIEQKLEEIGITIEKFDEKKKQLDKNLININQNLKIIQTSLWWIGTYAQKWRKKLLSANQSYFVPWSNFITYSSELNKKFLEIESSLMPTITDIHKDIIIQMQAKRQEPRTKPHDKFIIADDKRDTITLKEAEIMWKHKEIEFLLQHSLVLLKQRELRLASAKVPWDAALVNTQSALFTVLNAEFISNYVALEAVYKNF